VQHAAWLAVSFAQPALSACRCCWWLDDQELERKLARLAKTMDHTERARREEEGPFLEAAYQQRVQEDK
jgi:hypothetical protein